MFDIGDKVKAWFLNNGTENDIIIVNRLLTKGNIYTVKNYHSRRESATDYVELFEYPDVQFNSIHFIKGE